MNNRKDNHPIDIVISWVDGNDPRHKEKIETFSKNEKNVSCNDVGGKTRFANVGEIYYCIASIHKHMDFVRKIFIITDNQDPEANAFLSSLSINPTIPIEIIDHSVIFRGYEEYLPTFNSRSIETLMWRIPGLSENFIYMNDDFMILKPCTAEDFFREDKVVCYAKWYYTAVSKLLRFFKPRRKGHKPVSFKESMTNALPLIGERHRFLLLSHTPRALKRSFFENFYETHPDAVTKNIRHRFRNRDQYNSQELFYMNEFRADRCIVESPSRNLLYLMPKKKKNYIDRKLAGFEKRQNARFCCINSLDMATPEDIIKIISWLKEKIFIKEA